MSTLMKLSRPSKTLSYNVKMLESSLWSPSLTMVQPALPSPTLPIPPMSRKFNDVLELVHITTMELQRRPLKTIMSIATLMMLHSAIH